ncbi:ATP-binding protein [Kitasatospora sp. NPDC004240]
MPEACTGMPPSTTTADQSTWLPKRRRSAGAARRLLRDFLAAQPTHSERFAEVGELLLSELVSNAIEHPRVPSDRLILVRFTLSADELRIEVHDAGGILPASMTATATTAEPPDHDAESGRGLYLVQYLANSWGHFPRPGGIGKAVWCTVAPTDRADSA